MQRGQHAVGLAGAQRIKPKLAKHGWQRATFASDIIFIGNGGAHCMPCPLLVA